MKIIYPTAQTRQFYQQNGVNHVLTYAAGAVAPHVLTDRATYTVPANKRAVITNMHIMSARVTAAAPLGTVGIIVLVTLAGSGGNLVTLYYDDNTLNNWKNRDLPSQIWLSPGDTVVIRTFDNSTGGTVYYESTLTFMEFDG